MISATGVNSILFQLTQRKLTFLRQSTYPPAVGMSEGIARRRRSSGRITGRPDRMRWFVCAAGEKQPQVPIRLRSYEKQMQVLRLVPACRDSLRMTSDFCRLG